MAQEYLEKYGRIVYYCSHCRLCSIANYHELKDWIPICPSGAYFGFEAYFSSGRIEIIRGLLEGEIKDSKDLAKIVYSCNLCGGCRVQCKDHTALGEIQDQIEMFEDLRAALVDMGLGPMEGHQKIPEFIKAVHNPYNEAHDQRFAWLEDVKPKEDAKTLYFVGCTASYREQQIARATVKVFDRLGIDFSILGGDEWCCGSTLLRIGMRKEAIDVMEHNMKAIEDRNIETVVTSCAGCFNTFKHDYEKYLGRKPKFKLKHTVQVIAGKIRKDKIAMRPINRTVTYHDPCHLNRHSKVRKDPRFILKNIPGLKFKEMKRHGKNAWCCGAGGGVRSAFKDFSLWTVEERLKEVDELGDVDAIISACPFCELNLLDGVKQSNRKYEVLDLTELLLHTL